MRYELTDDEWAAIRQMMPNKPGPRIGRHLQYWESVNDVSGP